LTRGSAFCFRSTTSTNTCLFTIIPLWQCRPRHQATRAHPVYRNRYRLATSSAIKVCLIFVPPDLDSLLIIYCTSVLYSPGEKHKPGQRSWHEGLLIYYTINKKVGWLSSSSELNCVLTSLCYHQLILRTDRGVTLLESFSTPPPFPTSTNGLHPHTIKEEGGRKLSYPIGVSFQMGDSYTIEVEKLQYQTVQVSAVWQSHQHIHILMKFSLRQKLDIAALRQNSRFQRNSKKMTTFYEKEVPNILSKDYKYLEDETIPGHKRKADPLSDKDVNSKSTRPKTENKEGKSEKAPWQVINIASSRSRVSGLSKTPKRS
jgi:hypothetical protein